MPFPRFNVDALTWYAGDDIILTITPDGENDAAVAESTDWMKTLSQPLVTIRVGESNTTELKASSETDLILDGFTFPGPDGEVVPATDFTVPILTIIIPSAVTTTIGAGVRHIAIGALVGGVQETVMPPTEITVKAGWRP